MGGSSIIPHILDEHPAMENLIASEDNFVREQRLKNPDLISQLLLAPLWKIRSAYRDCMTPISFNIGLVGNIRVALTEASSNLSKTEDRDPMEIAIEVAAGCADNYTKYIWTLRQLLGKIKRILRRTISRKSQMIDNFYEQARDRDEFVQYANRVIYTLEISFLLVGALKDSILNAERVLNCSHENLYSMARFYYIKKLPFPPALSTGTIKYLRHFTWKYVEQLEKTKRILRYRNVEEVQADLNDLLEQMSKEEEEAEKEISTPSAASGQ